MQGVTGLSSLAFAALAFIFIFRARNALRSPAVRISWLASGVGAAAMFTRGTVIPLNALDAWLGGTNLINLVQNLAAATAFWLVMQAVTSSNSTLRTLRWRPLVLGLVAFTIPFFLINRGSTEEDFIVARSDQPALFIYASIYMAMVAVICTYLMLKIWSGRTVTHWILVGGSGLVALASTIEIVYLAAKCFNWWSPETQHTIGLLFDPLFYGGVVLIATSIARWAVQRAWRARRIRTATTTLERLLAAHSPQHDGASQRKPAPADERTALNYLYEQLIAAHDYARHDPDALREADWEAAISRATELLSAEIVVENTTPHEQRPTLHR